MLRKLLRYEFKALLRILPALYLALLVVAVAAGVSQRIAGDEVQGNIVSSVNIPTLLVNALGIMLFVLFTVNLVVVIHRFRDNLLKDEGYLMFTLPVSEWKLAASKGIAALCMFLLTGITWFLSLLVFGFITDPGEMLEQLPSLGEMLSGLDPLQLIIGTVTVLVVILQQIYLAYAAMTVSQLVPRFRGLAGFGVYLAVMIFVEYPITKAVRSLFYSYPSDLFREPVFLPVILLLEAAFAALYLWGTSWLLKHTVNLE
jgi:TM2 domain-containing membrane protein YozV